MAGLHDIWPAVSGVLGEEVICFGLPSRAGAHHAGPRPRHRAAPARDLMASSRQSFVVLFHVETLPTLIPEEVPQMAAATAPAVIAAVPLSSPAASNYGWVDRDSRPST